MIVSVVIPCYNVEKYVAASVGSALQQTHPELEVICVDDGSTDGTVAIIEQLQARHPDRIRLIRQANAGATVARNKGLEAATGTYVQFLDADDLLLPGKVAHQVALAQAHGLPELIVGSSRTVGANGREIQRIVQATASRDVWLDLMRTHMGNTVANLWARAAVLAAGGWNKGLRSSQEYDLMFRLLSRGARVVFDPEVLTEVRRRTDGSITQTNLEQNWARFVDLRLRIREHVRTHRIPHNEQAFTQFLFDSIRVLYQYDPANAMSLHDQHIPTGFQPTASPATSATYVRVHRLLGFRGAQRLWHLFH